MSFLETPRFPGCPSFGFVSQPDYLTSVVRVRSGREQRNRYWARPLYRYQVTVGPRMEDEIQALLEFWHAVGGMECGFRFKDWADFKSCRVGQEPTALDQPLIAVAGSPAAYQLTKRYTAGVRTQERPIYKPVQGTILLADNGTTKTETTDYVVDYATGLVSLNFTPVGALTWGGEFDVPVRFDSEFPVELSNHKIQTVTFALQELRL